MLSIPLAKRSLIAAVCSISIAAGAAAAAETTGSLNVPAGELIAALKALATQSNVELVYQPEQLRDIHTGGVQGTYSPQEAVAILLKGTSLKVVTSSSGAMVIAPASPPAGDRQKVSAVQPSAPVQLAQADASGQEEGTAAKEDSDAPAAGAQRQAIPEILVSGRRSLNSDIRRTEDDIQPYVVFDSKDIERSQAANLEEFLKSRLPMNAVQGTNSQSNTPDSPFGNQSSIDLRGLGTNQTLILVDGRRLPSISATAITSNFNQPDINGIPVAAIDRIEVLPSTASGIYGGSATGGVVNIVLKHDFNGLDIQGTYGNTFHSDASNFRLDATGGFSLEGGRTQVTLLASHAEMGVLRTGDRNFLARARQLQYANNSSAIDQAYEPPHAYTTNICSGTFNCDGTPLVLDNGTPLGASIAWVPVGYQGWQTDGGLALVPNAGHYNLDIANDLRSGTQALLSGPRVDSFSMDVRRSFGSRIDAFVGIQSLENIGLSYNSPLPNGVPLAADAPNNPFAGDILVSFPSPGFSATARSASQTLRTTGGLIARLPGNWSAGVDYSWSRSRNTLKNAGGVYSSFASDLSGTEFNFIRDLNAYPQDYSSILLANTQQIFGPMETQLGDTILRAAGPLYVLPAGPVSLNATFEHRREQAMEGWGNFPDGFTNELYVRFYPHRSQTVDSYYAELNVPLVSSVNARPGVYALELQGSVRRDGYETTSSPRGASAIVPERGDKPATDFIFRTNEVSSTDYTFGIRYAPVQDVALRARYSTGFLPPSISQIVPTTLVFNFPAFGFADPKRGDTRIGNGTSVTYLLGGSPDLQPELSKSWSAGIVLTPRVLSGLRLSVDYTKIDKTREIANVFPAEYFLQHEDEFPGRVVRGDKLPGDPAEWAGVVTQYDFSLVNIATATVEAYDIQADYDLRTDAAGEFHFYAIGTRQTKLERQTQSTSPTVNTVGTDGGPLAWRGNVGLDWTFRSWALGWNAQYYDAYCVNQDCSFDIDQDATRIPSQMYHDVTARYRFGNFAAAGGLMRNTEVRLGIQNVFNKNPPILAIVDDTGGYSVYGDPRLRRFTFSVRKSF